MAFPEVREFPVLKYTGLPDLVRSNGSPRSVFFARRSTLFFHDFPNAIPAFGRFLSLLPLNTDKTKTILEGAGQNNAIPAFGRFLSLLPLNTDKTKTILEGAGQNLRKRGKKQSRDGVHF